MNAIRGIRQEEPAQNYLPRLNQTDLEREIVAADWEAQLPTTYPLLAKTAKTIEVLGKYLAEVRFTVEALNNAVADCSADLEWLQPAQPANKPVVMSEVANREDGSKPTLDLSSASHTSRMRREAEEQRKRDEERKAKEVAELTAAVQAEAQRKPEPKRANIGLDSDGGSVPNRVNHARVDATGAAVLRDWYTVAEFKKLSPTDIKRYMQKFPGRNPLPNPPAEVK